MIDRDPARDWAEDFSHENGNYLCRCCECGHIFCGHKRRVVCRTCTTEKARVHALEETRQFFERAMPVLFGPGHDIGVAAAASLAISALERAGYPLKGPPDGD